MLGRYTHQQAETLFGVAVRADGMVDFDATATLRANR